MTALDIAIVVPGLPFNGKTATEQALGGSETAGYYMARELAKLGHHVRMFCNCDAPGMSPGTYEGVRYFPLNDWTDFCHFVPHDVTIIQRQPAMFQSPTSARLNWLWCHDLALGRQKHDVMGVMWNVDRVLVLSDYMQKQYHDVYGVSDASMLRTRNGIDLSLFAGLENIKRNRKRLVYAARPERGLDNLLHKVLPKLIAADPEIELHLCGYTNPASHLESFYQQIDALIRQNKDHVTWHGTLGKRQLYELFASAGIYAYPTPSQINAPFAEISCISVMEAQAAGLPVVTTNKGALNETLAPGAGTLVDGEAWSDAYVDAFVASVLELIGDDDKWNRASSAALLHAQNCSWEGVAQQWSDEMIAQIKALSARPDSLVRHFWRHSDIMAAREVINRHPGEVGQDIIDRIETDWAFTKSADAYREQYEKIGKTHGPNIGHEVHEPRFQVLLQQMNDHPECTRIIDYGCAYGNYLLNLIPKVEGRQWIGLDVDKNSIALARQHAEKLLTEEQRASLKLMTVDREEWATFKTGPADTDVKLANCLILYEVLEHVMDPIALIDRVEKLVEPGGRIMITVPFGPWEYDSYHTYPHRCHLWEYDWHDLRDLFGGKSGVQIAPMLGGTSAFTGEPLGWWLVEYVVTPGVPTGSINMDRKLAIQRPEQSVSATMIAGPNAEENLHWCLNSLRHTADELVVVDCGMSDEAKRIVNYHADWYRGACKLVPGPDPKIEGFETPRNIGLEHCTMDLVLWIDTDEKLLGGRSVRKYLRENIYNGYCIRQVHFACDTTFDPDTPVRIFRNPSYHPRTKGMRFFGMIHEHPELALNAGPGLVITLADVYVPHVGYLNEEIRRGRFARNYPLLQKDIEKYPDRLLQKHFIIRDKVLLCVHELQRNGQRMTAAIKSRCEDVVAMYRKYFLGKSPYAGLNTLQYYSQAVQMLGIGAEVAFQFAAAKDGVPRVNGTQVVRFASMEDMEAEVLKLARKTMEPYVNEVW